jgi:hypothetical protein
MNTRERELLAREAELSRREKVTESNLETIIPPLGVCYNCILHNLMITATWINSADFYIKLCSSPRRKSKEEKRLHHEVEFQCSLSL